MLARQRQEHILERVTAAGGVRVADVVNELGISEMTARRDITELVAQGLVERVHGGAVAPSTSSAVTSRRRTDQTVLRSGAHVGRAAGQEPVTDAAPPTSPASSPTSTVRTHGRREQVVPGSGPSHSPLPSPAAGTGTTSIAGRQASPAATSPAAPDQRTSTGIAGRPVPAAGAGAAGTLPSAAGPALAPGTGPAADGGIGAYAAALVRPGDSVALSGGSTALDVARALARTPHFPTLTVVTTSLPAAQLLFDAVDATSAVGPAGPTSPTALGGPTGHGAPASPDGQDGPATPDGPADPAAASPTTLTTPAKPQDRPTVVLTGGQRTPSGTLAGPTAVNALAPMHVDWVFLAADGFSPETGLTASSLAEAATSQALAATGRTVVAVVDARAWGAVALATFCATRDIDVLVTDAQPDDWAAQALRDVGTTLVVASASPPGPAKEPSAHSPAPPGPAAQARHPGTTGPSPGGVQQPVGTRPSPGSPHSQPDR